MSFATSLRVVLLACAFGPASLRADPATPERWPAPGATAVCPDTPLRLTFPQPVALAQAGLIKVVDAETGAVADTLDTAAAVSLKTIGGEPDYRYHPVLVNDRVARLFPRNGTLTYGRTYRVEIDAGVFVDAATRTRVSTGVSAWTFATKASRPAPPAAGNTRLVVAADGSGDFCTVQGALDFIPAGNTTPVTIFLRRGRYEEIVFFTEKHAVTIVGEDRAETVLTYATNDRFNPSRGNPFGTPRPDPSAARPGGGSIYHRGVFLAHRVNDLTLTNFTIRNSTPQGGSQAEAIILNGTTTARAVLKDLDLYSYQDTLQINGQAYVSGCYIEGDVDFMWGTGPCYFTNCTARALRSGAYYTQIRNPATNHGYVYVGCTFDGIQGVMGNYLSRIGTGRFPHSEVVLIDCTLTSAVDPQGWVFSGGREGNENDPAQVHFWEHNSRDDSGRPVNDAFRRPGSKRLGEADADTVSRYRDPVFVLGSEWDPRNAAIFSAAPPVAGEPAATLIRFHPSSALALLGTPAAMSVTPAASVPSATIQWYRDGAPIPGATEATLRVPAMRWTDAGVYGAEVSVGTRRTRSRPARLTAVAPQAANPPRLPSIPGRWVDVTTLGAVGDGITDNTAAFQQGIDRLVAAGGGTLVVPAAERPYRCGPLTLGHHLAIEIAAGATVQLLPYSAAGGIGAYPVIGSAHPNFLTASKVHDLALVGGGTIDGEGDAWWDAFRADERMPKRPYLVRFTQCERVLISGLTFTRSPMFHVAVAAQDLTVAGVTINSPYGAPNTDGLDPAGSRHLIQNCEISVGDDNLVLKPGGTFCSDITVADCAFGAGHGLSVGGQTNRGLDGMEVKNCSFDGTVTGIRLKADPTQGGDVRNITYTNLTMQRVRYPIVFYSYYNRVGNPGSPRGGNHTSLERFETWNREPPNPLDTPTLPRWRNLSINRLLASEAGGYSIIWGLPRPGYFVEGVRIAGARIDGSPGFKVLNAADVSFANSAVGEIIAANALVLTRTPAATAVKIGADVELSADVAPDGRANLRPTFRYTWRRNGELVTDGVWNGTEISGATTAILKLRNVTAGVAGDYTITVSAQLDVFHPESNMLEPAAGVVTSTVSATLTIQ